ncbi:MAG: hypothetical protein JW969_04700 [Spirochaetales bacterium]|nr:hypothetical protein [Spirochaetales bacterium]
MNVKVLIVILMLLFIFTNLSGENLSKWTFDENEVKGKIKSYTLYEVIYKENFGAWIEQARYKVITQNYDEQGRIMDTVVFNMDGSVKSKGQMKYNSRGDLIEERGYTADNILIFKSEYKYDSNGKNTEKTMYSAGNVLLDKMIFTYDNRGNRIEEAQYNGDGSIRNIVVFSYDNSGHLREKLEYRADGMLVFCTRYQYDNRGWLKEKAELTPDDTLVSKKVYSMDSYTNVDEILCVNSAGITEVKISYSFDDKSNWVKKIRSRLFEGFGKKSYNPYAGEYREIEYY